MATYHAPRRFGLLQTCALAVAIAVSVWGSPQRVLAQESGITSPSTGASIGGDVPVIGTAVIEPFQKYELHYKLEPSNDDAYIYFTGATSPVSGGQLGTWQAGGLPAGVYSLRLRVVKNDGNYAEYFAKNLSVNLAAAAPSATPTSDAPTPTPIPTATFTPAPQPTPAVGAVAQPAIEGDATPTPEVVAVAVEPVAAAEQPLSAGSPAVIDTGAETAAAEESGSSLTRDLGEALSLNRLRTQFFSGMRFSAALFVGLLALYGGKRLFDWVWAQFT